MNAGLPGHFAELFDAAGDAFEGVALTDTQASQHIAPGPYLFLGLFVKVTPVTGTDETLNVTLEVTPDSGATWFSMPSDVNADGQASMAEFTDVGLAFKYWAIPAVSNKLPGSSDEMLYRFVFTVAGTTPSFTPTIVRYVRFAPTN